MPSHADSLQPPKSRPIGEKVPVCRERTVALAQVAAAERAKVVYVYDFGDDWRHDVVVPVR